MYPFVRNNGSQKYVFVHSPAADLTFTFRTTFHKNVILLLGLGWFTAWHVSQPCATTDNPYVSLGIECWCYTSGTLCIMFCFCAADSFLNLRIHLSIFSYHASKVLIVKIFVCPYYKSLLLMHYGLGLVNKFHTIFLSKLHQTFIAAIEYYWPISTGQHNGCLYWCHSTVLRGFFQQKFTV